LNLLQEMRARRILPAVGVYVGACWVVVEILDRLVDRYFLSPYLTDIVFWGLYSLLPAVILLAWTHGRPGKDKVTRLEKVGIPANLIATVGLLLTVFGGKDLGATAELVTVANELGEQEEHYVPRDSYRRRLAMFFWQNQSGDPAHDWLQYAVTELLTQDLQQNPFLLPTSPWGNGYYRRMKAAGFEDGLGIPLSLKREIAEAAGRAYFVDGTIGRQGADYLLTARIWNTDSLELLAEHAEQGRDLLPAVDRLSVRIKESLDVPSGRSGLSGDLPLSETYGASEQALQLFIQGLNAVLFENDREKSNRFYEDALAADPGFVLAWFYKGFNQLEQGNVSGAQASLAAAQKLDYRLPERDQVKLKGLTYRISGEQEKLERFLRLQTQVQNDAASHRDLARFLMLTGQLEESKGYYLQVMERDSSDVASLLSLAALERSTGQLDSAVGYARRYVAARPNHAEGHLLLGDLYLLSADFDAARDTYEQAQLLEDPAVMPTLRLAQLEIRRGEWSDAQRLIEEAASLASGSAVHESAVLRLRGQLAFRRGNIHAAIDILERFAAVNREILSPMEQIFEHNIPLIQFYMLLGRLDQAESVLDATMQLLQPPLNQFLSFSEVQLRARKGEFEAAEAALRDGMEAIELFKADYLAFQIPLSAALIAREKRDYSAAAAHFQEAIDGIHRSVMIDELQPFTQFHGECARMHVLAGELDQAQSVLDHAFRRDSANPNLWVARAMLQRASGSPAMAMASINYALAIWTNADPDYVEYRDALTLRDELATFQGP
jgi:tetratricopeptide (TPR) repeat protein